MNKRVEKFARECGAWNQVYGNRNFMIDEHFDVEKFAELIVEECMDICKHDSADDDDQFDLGRVYQAKEITQLIKIHFGVEE